MKDAHQRRRDAEMKISRPLPTIEPSLISHPTRQDRLVKNGQQIVRLDVQENDFIVTTTKNWAVTTYNLDATAQPGNDAAVSDTCSIPEDEFVPDASCSSAWQKIAHGGKTMHNVIFITKDVIVTTEQSGRVSTWCVRSAQRLDRVNVRSVDFSWAMCKINDEQFVVGDTQGHICLFTHTAGRELKEVRRIRKAHYRWVASLVVCGNLMISSSHDGTACLWDLRNWRRVLTVYHQGPLINCALSSRYFMTNSLDDFQFDMAKKRQLRIYRIDENGQDCSLVKLYITEDRIWMPRFSNDGNVFMCWIANDDRRELLTFFKLDTDSVLAQIKVQCSWVLDYGFLADGRLVACGESDTHAVVATLPKHLHKLITPAEPATSGKVVGKQRFCTIV